MFHEWDKQLRRILADEIAKWLRSNALSKAIWRANFMDVVKLLKSFGMPLDDSSYFKALDECRLVVNVYKHGKGPAFTELVGASSGKQYWPFSKLSTKHIDYSDLAISDFDLERFSAAFIAFWESFPMKVMADDVSSIPDWFEKELKRNGFLQ